MIKIFTCTDVLWIEDSVQINTDGSTDVSNIILGVELKSKQELDAQVEKLVSLFQRYNVPVKVIPFPLDNNV
jgi:hypothetical protein